MSFALDVPQTPHAKRRMAWTPSPTECATWTSPKRHKHKPVQSERPVRMHDALPTQHDACARWTGTPSIFFGTPQHAERAARQAAELVRPGLCSATTPLRAAPVDFEMYGSPGVARAQSPQGSAWEHKVLLRETLGDVSNASPASAYPAMRPSPVQGGLHDAASSKLQRPLSPAKSPAPTIRHVPPRMEMDVFSSPPLRQTDRFVFGVDDQPNDTYFYTGPMSPAKPASPALSAAQPTPHRPPSTLAHNAPVFRAQHAAGTPASLSAQWDRAKTSAVESIRARASRVSAAEENAAAHVPLRNTSPLRASASRLLRPVKFATSVPASRVWDPPKIVDKEDEQPPVPPPKDVGRAQRISRPRAPLRPTTNTEWSAPQAPSSHGDVEAAEEGRMREEKTSAASALHAEALEPGRSRTLTRPRRVPVPRPRIPPPPPMSATELQRLTSKHTRMNGAHTVEIDTHVQRIYGERPASPSAAFHSATRTRALHWTQACVAEMNEIGECVGHALGAGEDEAYITPPACTERKARGVRWDKRLVVSPTLVRQHSKPPRSALQHKPLLDAYGNVGGPMPLPRTKERVAVKRLVYDDDIEQV
ncbi:hypothetical protein MVES1_003247 [Malassezia vespertilionis]|nr:uncharacterized protein MVES1_003247 [Malassezia vespertilionis]WFD07879.1 hypothetical protein MVES1_003247 [Malassezia vespertilionis]